MTRRGSQVDRADHGDGFAGSCEACGADVRLEADGVTVRRHRSRWADVPPERVPGAYMESAGAELCPGSGLPNACQACAALRGGPLRGPWALARPQLSLELVP